MKTLRYLLIVIAVVSFLGAYAQDLAQRPEVQMQSTSGMVYSGSTLPQAAAEGAYVTGTAIGTYTPADAGKTGGPHRAKTGLGGGGGSGGPGDRPEPYADPIGDGMVVLLLFTCAYLVYRVYRRKRV